ncbi:MAG: O-antigen ligase family protein [Paracoccaceae bacterium]|uniref:O-antigen ligase family protein n=1 Tax=Parasphingorhabdus sp. TaxID=2709688 RepID=UPI00326C4095
MGPTIAGISYLGFALFVSLLIIPKKEECKWKYRAVLYWIVMSFLFFLIPYKPVVLFLSAVVLLILKPRSDLDCILFYIVVFPSVPLAFFYKIPFPGINYLIDVDFQIIAPVVVLISGFVFSKPKNQVPEWPVFLYILLIVAVSLYKLPLTSSLRYGVGLFLMYFLPFLALARAPVKFEDLVKFFDALLTLAIILGCIAIVFQLTKWNIYGYFYTESKIWKFQEYRYGLLRVSASVTSTSLAFLASCGIVAMSVTKSFADSSKILRLALLGVFSLTILFSMARGGWLAAIVMLSFYRLLISHKSNSAIALVLLSASVLCVIFLQSTQLNEVDPYGTFEYRRELYKAAILEFYNNPFFGDINFKTSGNFDHLIQGEGIIDIVSVYLEVLLSYGVFGFSMIFGAYLFVLFKLFRIRGEGLNDIDGGANKIVSATISIIISYLIMIGTISEVGFVGTIGYILLGIGYSVVREIEGGASTLAESRGPVPKI